MRPILLPLSLLLCLLFANSSHAQVGVGTTNPDKSAVLDVSGTNRGFLAPRMSTTQRNAIVKPAKGLMVFDMDSAYFFYFDGTKWRGVGNTNFSLQKLTTVQRLAISSPTKGELVFDLDSGYYFDYNGTTWKGLGNNTTIINNNNLNLPKLTTVHACIVSHIGIVVGCGTEVS